MECPIFAFGSCDLDANSKIISAFTDRQAARLTGLSVAQLQNWDRTGFFSPSLADANRRSAFSRIYTFQDLLSLQVLKTLRKDMGCSLQHLREVKGKLEELGDQSWSQVTLFVLNRRVVFHDEPTDTFFEPVGGQQVFKIPLLVVKRNMEAAVQGLWKRDQQDIGKTETKKRVAGSNEVVAGTRVTVESIRDFIEVGYSDLEIVEEFPSLDIQDVRSVRKGYAA